MNYSHRKTIFLLSLSIVVLVSIVSSIGLFTTNFYFKETLNWQAQSIGQDMVDLFLIAPCLFVVSYLVFRNNINALLVLGGVLLYIIYAFVIYCFDVHFNQLFVFYCMILSLAFYTFLYTMYIVYLNRIAYNFEHRRYIKFLAIYFLIISVLFYALWLFEIVPSIIRNTVPASLIESGLFTNAVHVIDLSVFLPAIFMIGIMLLRKNILGYFFAPIMLTFFVLMDITIGLLVVVMEMRGIGSDITLTMIMAILTIISLFLLISFIRSNSIKIKLV